MHWSNVLVFQIIYLVIIYATGNPLEKWDPLPQDIRTIVSSNHISKNPKNAFAEYHALLPNYRGDYGIKSKIVEGASNDPTYDGVNTFLLPFYIPQGALPLAINQRRVRSGNAGGIANMRVLRGPSPAVRDSSIASAINRHVRRVFPSARRVSTTPRSFPTPPPSYLQTWVKRKTGNISSTPEEYGIDRIKASKRILLTQPSNSKKIIEDSVITTDVNLNKSKILPGKQVLKPAASVEVNNNSSSKNSKGFVRIKKITSRIQNKFGSKQSASRIKIPSPTTEAPRKVTDENSLREKADDDTKLPLHNQTQNPIKKIRNSHNRSSLNVASSGRTIVRHTDLKEKNVSESPDERKSLFLYGTRENIVNSSTLKALSNPRSTSITPVIRKRVLGPVQKLELMRKRLKPVVPFRSPSELDSSTTKLPEANGKNDSSSSVPDALIPGSTPKPSTSKTKKRNNITSKLKKISDTTTEGTIKTPDWLHRRRQSIQKQKEHMKTHFTPTVEKQTLEPKENVNSKSIIDRVLNSTSVLLNSSTTADNETISINKTSLEKQNKSTDFPMKKVKLSDTIESHKSKIFQRSFGAKLPEDESKSTIIRNSNDSKDVKNNYSKSNLDPHSSSQRINKNGLANKTENGDIRQVSLASFHNTSFSSRKKIPLKNRFNIVSNPVHSTVSSTRNLQTSGNIPVSFNPTIRSVLKNNLTGRTVVTTSSPSTTVQTTTSSTTIRQTIGKTTLKVIHSSSQPRDRTGNSKDRSLASSFMHKLRSPQDIVLEKLSELMKNATSSNESNLEMIVQEIEKLNKELAYMGIHIIDAEFAGQKIRLKDQPILISKGGTSSKASTIRYFIPNSKSQSQVNPYLRKVPLRNINSRNNSSFPTSVRQLNKGFHQSSGPTHITRFPTKYYSDFPTPVTAVTSSSPTNKPPSSHKLNTKGGSHLLEANPEFSSMYKKLKESLDTKSVLDESQFDETSEEFLDVPSSFSTSLPDSYFSTSDKRLLSTPSTINIDQNTIFELSKEQGIVSDDNAKQTAHFRPTEFDIIYHKSTIDTGMFLPKNENSDEIINSILRQNGNYTFDHPIHLTIAEDGTTLQNETVSSNSSSYLYFVGLLSIVPCVAILAFLYRQRQKRKQKSLPEREESADEFVPPTKRNELLDEITFTTGAKSISHNETLDAFPGYIFESSVKRDSPWELSRSKLRLTSIIGEGNFGVVWKAEARNLCEWEKGGGPTVLVAVKGVKESAGKKEKSDLLRELSIMQHLGQHAHIVTLLGCCTTHEPYYLVMEYVMFGKLLTFLREQRSKNNYYTFSADSEHLTSKDLIKFAHQIAIGCEYLQSRGVIHRDLAARNILVDHKKVCKIADFGLARSVKDLDSDIYEQKSRGPLPIRWMSPESLFMNIFTHKSDVWSFGILCWEILTLGSTPYPGISAREVMRRVREGYRLERPEHCRSEFYRIVGTCWHQDRSKRASFTNVKDDLRKLLDSHSEWIDLENFQESTYYSMHQNNDEKL